MDSQSLEQAKEYAVRRMENELSPGLFYHSLAHTRDDVVPAVEMLARMEGIEGDSLIMLLTAAWFHDLGFIEQRLSHEAISARMATEALPGFGYSQEQIRIIKDIILATILPQSPSTILERIMSDGDLDLLGRDDFFVLNQRLRRELAFFGQESSDIAWYSGQLKFVAGHTYFTASARALRDAGQRRSVAILRQTLGELSPGK
jgi:uncharacterized protein